MLVMQHHGKWVKGGVMCKRVCVFAQAAELARSKTALLITGDKQ